MGLLREVHIDGQPPLAATPWSKGVLSNSPGILLEGPEGIRGELHGLEAQECQWLINEETKLLLHLGMTYSKVPQKTIHRLVVVMGDEESRHRHPNF